MVITVVITLAIIMFNADSGSSDNINSNRVKRLIMEILIVIAKSSSNSYTKSNT